MYLSSTTPLTATTCHCSVYPTTDYHCILCHCFTPAHYCDHQTRRPSAAASQSPGPDPAHHIAPHPVPTHLRASRCSQKRKGDEEDIHYRKNITLEQRSAEQEKLILKRELAAAREVSEMLRRSGGLTLTSEDVAAAAAAMSMEERTEMICGLLPNINTTDRHGRLAKHHATAIALN